MYISDYKDRLCPYICKDKFFYTIQNCNCPRECKHARAVCRIRKGNGRRL